MKITVEITLPDAELTALLNSALAVFTNGVKVDSSTTVDVEVEKTEEAKPARTRKKSEPVKTEDATETYESEPTPEAAAAPAPVETEETTTAAPAAAEVTKEQVLKAAAEYMKTVKDGPAKVSKMLKQLGASRVSEIPAEKLADFLALLAVE